MCQVAMVHKAERLLVGRRNMFDLILSDSYEDKQQ